MPVGAGCSDPVEFACVDMSGCSFAPASKIIGRPEDTAGAIAGHAGANDDGVPIGPVPRGVRVGKPHRHPPRPPLLASPGKPGPGVTVNRSVANAPARGHGTDKLDLAVDFTAEIVRPSVRRGREAVGPFSSGATCARRAELTPEGWIMSKVLVAYATKMGGTAGIAQAIADELRSCGLTVDVHDADAVRSISGYDAAVLGSAVYAGRWRRSAVALLRRFARAARAGDRTKVWLFHSGPTGPDATNTSVPAPRKVAELAAALGAAAPTTFGGRVESGTAKGFIARRIAESDLGGDYRDLDHVREWAHRIGVSVSVLT
jgi:menaquinone-dependent protoporphyrinogen oxidase